jgi:hypothetical protein
MFLKCSRRIKRRDGMTQTSIRKKQSSDFASWLRTGRLPPVRDRGGVERKFNPWHDPSNGRFTFAGAGSVDRANAGKARVPARPSAGAARDKKLMGDQPGRSGEIAARPKPLPAPRRGDPLNPVTEFVGGVGEGLYGVAKGTATGIYSALTTNPLTTARNVEFGVAGMIDTALAAEDTPARIQIARAADAIAHATPRQVGRVTGSAIGNIGMVAVPEAALGKLSALSDLRMVPPRPVYAPPQIGWVAENLGPEKAATLYNDAATGARSGQAPTLMRTMADGSKRPVKFDGIEGDYVIDRKLSVGSWPRAQAQVLRQSQALEQNRLMATWEVPNEVQRVKALKLLKKMNATRIKVRIVKP